MFGSRGIEQYRKVEVETSVPEASPHRLVLMLMDGALVAIGIAITKLKENDIPHKGEAISKAIALIDEGLRPSLNLEEGGDIARNLDSLYDYMAQQLFLANLHNDSQRLEEVSELLSDIRDAWRTIGGSDDLTQAPAPTPAP
ncbi:MAG: flagellar export chaperone FliS [Pseudomonadota bacterium]|jgi:flagellar protein FliS